MDQKRLEKRKTRLHLHGPPQVHTGSCPHQLPQYCSRCLPQQRANRPHPLILLHATHRKNTSPLFTTRFSLLILKTSQPRLSPPVQHSYPCLCSLAWEGRSWGVQGGNRNHWCWSNKFRGLPRQGSCSHGMSQEHAIALLCVQGAWQTRREFSMNVKNEKTITLWLRDVRNCNKVCWQLSQFFPLNNNNTR